MTAPENPSGKPDKVPPDKTDSPGKGHSDPDKPGGGAPRPKHPIVEPDEPDETSRR